MVHNMIVLIHDTVIYIIVMFQIVNIYQYFTYKITIFNTNTICYVNILKRVTNFQNFIMLILLYQYLC